VANQNYLRQNGKVKKVKLFLCLTNYALRHEDVWGSGCIDRRFLEVSRQLHAAAALPPSPRGKITRYPLDRRLGGPKRPMDDMKKLQFLTMPGLELRPLCRPATSQSLYRLRYSNSLSVRIIIRSIIKVTITERINQEEITR
jgi:hypothetical protein